MCYDKYNSGSIAMIVIGVFLLISGVAGMIFLFGVKKNAMMAALGRVKADE